MGFYDLDYSIKSFAVANDFVINTNKACYKLGSQLIPFCMYADEKQTSYGVVDFATFGGFLDQNKSLIDEIAQYRQDLFKDFGLILDSSNDLQKKYLFYDYLMTISVCYVEVPKYITKDGLAQESFDKFLCTRNPAIMATWMGLTPNEMQAKYSSKIKTSQIDIADNNIRFVKLNKTAKGNTITVPRTVYNIEKMRCVPLYMLYAFVEGFKPILNDGILKFYYAKDNGTIRELNSTLSRDILKDYYDDVNFINVMLSGVDINTVQQGGMLLSSKINRGYIKIPELGASVYDGTGVRSLNIARLLKIEKVDSVDRSFINVDLNSVVVNFQNCLDYLIKNNPNEIKSCCKAIMGDDFPTNVESPASIANSCSHYVEGRAIFLSTEYLRELHMFMVSHPEWFPLYTGKPVETVVKSSAVGVVPMDF